MKKSIHKKLKIKTLSYSIISPRDAEAFYKGVDFESDDINENLKDVNIIYPFYQYGLYEQYNPGEAQYYIPGSSVKGALLKNTIILEGMRNKIMVDDFDLSKKPDAITLKQIYKYQYLHPKEKTKQNQSSEPDKQIKYGVFFPNVAVEMLKPGVEVISDFYYDEVIEKEILDMLSTKNKDAREKLEDVREYLYNLGKKMENEKKEEGVEIIPKINMQVQTINKTLKTKNNIMALGGYKGLLRALSGKIENDEDKGALFIDDTTHLPYGIVEICFVDEPLNVNGLN